MIEENVNDPVASEPHLPIQPPITELEWGFTKNMGNFQNQRLSVTMPVGADEDPELVLAEAQQWVRDHLAPSTDELWGTREELQHLQTELFRIRSAIDKMNDRYGKLRAALNKLGMNLPESLEELPF